jgi:protein-disulfide isomerase
MPELWIRQEREGKRMKRSLILPFAALLLGFVFFLWNSNALQAFDRYHFERDCEKCHKLIHPRADFTKIPLDRMLVMGNVSAPWKVAVFTDPDSPDSRELHEEMEKILQERKDITFYIILYPSPFHKDAYWKSQTILCHRSLKMLAEAYAGREIPRLECNSEEVDANIRIGEALGIRETPTLVLPNGKTRYGLMLPKQLVDFIQGGR